MPNPIQQLLEQLSPGFRPTEPDYGMSDKAEMVKQALGAYQAQGEKPPMPADGGVPPFLQLMEFLQRIQAAGGMQNAPQEPMGPQAQPMQGRHGSADTEALLQKLLAGS